HAGRPASRVAAGRRSAQRCEGYYRGGLRRAHREDMLKGGVSRGRYAYDPTSRRCMSRVARPKPATTTASIAQRPFQKTPETNGVPYSCRTDRSEAQAGMLSTDARMPSVSSDAQLETRWTAKPARSSCAMPNQKVAMKPR